VLLDSDCEQQIGYDGMARKAKRIAWTKQDVSNLKAHSKRKTPVVKISKEMKRTAGALRQKALSLGISIGHRR
jgi:hypothetical protein